ALRDSIHTINYSKVALDTQSEEIIFDDFTVSPNNLIGKKGLPVVDAKIPKVSLKTRSLTSLQSTGDILVKEMELSQPEIILYMDQEDDLLLNKDRMEKPAQNILKNLTIDDFVISQGSLSLREKGKLGNENSFQ